MKIVENRALEIITKKYAQIRALIPRSEVLEVRGDKGRVLVFWGLDEWRVLRNLGIKNIPHPIRGRYKWPGMYRPFDHQRTTAEFLAANHRCFVFNEQGCVDADTEYLTPTGWRRIADYDGGVVGQFDPDTNRVTFVEPTEYIKLPCEHMVRIRTKYGVDQLLSAEHRVLLYANDAAGLRANKRVVLSAAEVARKHDEYHAGLHSPRGRTVGTPTVSFRHMAIRPHFIAPGGEGVCLSDAQLRLQIAVIADGHFASQTTQHCVIRLKRDRKITRLRQLLADAGVEFTERVSTAPTAVGFHVFTFNAPLRVKEFDARFWEATPEQLAVVRDEVMHWDGCTREGAKGWEFVSISKASADFVQYAFAGDEYITSIRQDSRAGRYRNGVCYVVYVRKKTGANLLALHSRVPSVFDEPPPDGFKYCFSVPTTYLVLRRNGRIFTTGNTGKTMSAAWAADYLMTKGQVKRVLVVCPVSIMDTAWRADLFRTLMHRKVGIAQGTRQQREKVINGDYEFVIINFDGVKVVLDTLLKGGFDLVIVDEASQVKTATTGRWKALNKLVPPTVRVWAMTGTPAAQSPLDAYGLAKLVNPSSVPRFFTAWRDMVMLKLTQYKWVARASAQDTVRAVLQPAIRFTKEECLDLPDQLYTTREVPLTPQQSKYYETLRKQMAANAAGAQITAANAAAQLNKLLQLSQGSVYTDDGQIVDFDITPRVDELMDVILGTRHKVLVFVPYRNVLERLETELNNRKSAIQAVDQDSYDVAHIHGGTPATQRAEIIKEFQTQDRIKVLLLVPQAAAHGITLTRADQIVWWGPVPSVETYLQANARAHRAGQTNKVTVTHLQGSPAERRMYAALQGNVDRHLDLVSLYKQEIA